MNTRDLGIGAGKGDKSRVTSAEVFRARFPDSMGVPTQRVRSACCEAPFVYKASIGSARCWHECLSCGNACDVRVVKIS